MLLNSKFVACRSSINTNTNALYDGSIPRKQNFYFSVSERMPNVPSRMSVGDRNHLSLFYLTQFNLRPHSMCSQFVLVSFRKVLHPIFSAHSFSVYCCIHAQTMNSNWNTAAVVSRYINSRWFLFFFISPPFSTHGKYTKQKLFGRGKNFATEERITAKKQYPKCGNWFGCSI